MLLLIMRRIRINFSMSFSHGAHLSHRVKVKLGIIVRTHLVKVAINRLN